MSVDQPGSETSDRSVRIQAIVEDFLRRRAAGEVLSATKLAESHPDLQPELTDELAKLKFVGASLLRSDATDSGDVETIAHYHSDTGSGQLEVRCPHCHEAMSLDADSQLADLSCQSCGNHFSLIDDTQATWTADTLTTMGRFELIKRLGVGGFGAVEASKHRQRSRGRSRRRLGLHRQRPGAWRDPE